MRFIFICPAKTGKTFLIKELLEDYEVITFKKREEYKKNRYIDGDDFIEFLKSYVSAKDVAVEIGENFFKTFEAETEFMGLNDFLKITDKFIVPITADKEGQEAGILTVKFLKKINALDKTLIIYNKRNLNPLEKQFKKFVEFLETEKITVPFKQIKKFDDEVIEYIYKNGFTLQELAKSKKNYLEEAEKLLEDNKKDEAAEAVTIAYWKMNAEKILKNLEKIVKPSLISTE